MLNPLLVPSKLSRACQQAHTWAPPGRGRKLVGGFRKGGNHRTLQEGATGSHGISKDSLSMGDGVWEGFLEEVIS